MPGIEVGAPDWAVSKKQSAVSLCPCSMMHRKGDVGRALSPVDRLCVSGAKGRRARIGSDPSELEEWRVPVPI